jgi:hypothetical protein
VLSRAQNKLPAAKGQRHGTHEQRESGDVMVESLEGLINFVPETETFRQAPNDSTLLMAAACISRSSLSSFQHWQKRRPSIRPTDQPAKRGEGGAGPETSPLSGCFLAILDLLDPLEDKEPVEVQGDSKGSGTQALVAPLSE